MSAGYTNLWAHEECCTNPEMMAQALRYDIMVARLHTNHCTHVISTSSAYPVLHDANTHTLVFRAFSSVVRQMPGYNSQRRGTAGTLLNYAIIFTRLVQR